MNLKETKNNIPLIKHIPGPHKIRRLLSRQNIKSVRLRYLMHHNKRKYADYLFNKTFGYSIDWKHPRDLNEWINYLAFKTDTKEWTRLADKFEVRSFVKERGLSHILLQLYGVWGRVSEIDFNTLPDSFAIKTNCSCGDTIIVGDKRKSDFVVIREKLNDALNQRKEAFLRSAEPHYLRIRQLIVCEQLVPGSVVDYKIWCFHGEPFGIFTCSNRNHETHEVDFNMFDLEWNRHDEWMTEEYRNDVEVAKPRFLTEMIEYARVLSQGFPEVRVDFYETAEQVFFGEMTFTSYCGRMTYFTYEILQIMGDKVKKGLEVK